MNLGIIHGEPAEDYFASGAVGSHALGDFADSPLLYKRKHVTKEAAAGETTAALGFGTYFHAGCVEGEDAVAARYVVSSEKFDRRTTAGKAGWAAFCAANEGKTIISRDDADLSAKMLLAIREKKTCRELFSRGKPEVTFRNQVGPFAVQCRCDWFDETLDEWQRPLIVDVKTVESLAAFDKQFVNFGYYRQAAFYQLVVSDTMKLQGAYPRFVFVVAEKSEPFDVAIYTPDEATLEHGRAECLALLKRLKAAYLSSEFPGQPDAVQTISLPEWKLMKGNAA